MTEHIAIHRAESATEDVCGLVMELEAELAQHYAQEQRHGLAVEAIFQPHVRFFVASVDGEPAGCGGIAMFSDFAELKRMYVRPAFRGKGIADALVSQLAAEAADAGLSILRLETGDKQFAALRFYERCGFSPCDAFEPYASMPAHKVSTSLYLEKRLTPT